MADTTRKPETFHLTAEAQSALPQQAQIALQQVDNLKYFLISAPVDWSQDQYIRRFLLPTAEYVSCILWRNLFHITGTDIVRCLAFRFHAFGRPVKNSKKFEEGIFSDLRNLKAGNDASLEEPKSPFLDFLYKNNCIRTQKKQKVFYWYSVPHDRLFLDALERDLKREKAGQEPTTESTSEPSLSFAYDPTRSLFEQLTKPDEQSEGSEHGLASHSRSPSAVRAASSAPQQTVSSATNYLSGNMVNDNIAYSQSMPTANQMSTNQMSTTMDKNPMMTNLISTGMTKTDQMYNHVTYGPVNNSSNSATHYHNDNNGASTQPGYDRSGIPYEQYTIRQSSLPTYYMEPSPAPSFVSAPSYYEDNSRAVSYEPVTPPQYTQNYATDPCYGGDESAFYGAHYDLQQGYNMAQNYTMSMPPPPPPRFNSVPRRFAPSSAQYTHIEGSPHYKQRRRTNSLTGSFSVSNGQMAREPHMSHARASPYSVRRPSDLRRSVSASVVPQMPMCERAASGPPGSTAYMHELQQTPGVSRQSSPLASVEGQVLTQTVRPRYGSFASTQSSSTTVSNGPGVMRRARSATTEISPYPLRSHTCPIPTCGRTFKRLEHLKRHVRTHTQEKPYQCNLCDKAFSRSDNLAQHRRTHEPNSEFAEDDEDIDGEGSDSCAGLTEDIDSPESITYSAAPVSMMPMADTMEDFGMANVGKQQAFADVSSVYYGPDCMGPPALPMGNHGYSF